MYSNRKQQPAQPRKAPDYGSDVSSATVQLGDGRKTT